MGFVKAGGWIAIGPSLALVARVLLISNREAIIVVAPALIGIVVVSWPGRRWVLIAALVLVGATATYWLIGGIGLLYVPSLVLIVRGALGPQRAAHSQP